MGHKKLLGNDENYSAGFFCSQAPEVPNVSRIFKRIHEAPEERHDMGSNKYSCLKSISYSFKNARYSI